MRAGPAPAAVAALRARPELLVVLAAFALLPLLPGRLPLGVLGLGVVQGAVLALHAAGIVLVFRSNRFLNIAQVQIGAVAGTLFAVLVNAQPLFRATAAVCPPCLERISPTATLLNYGLSLVVALAASVGLSWLAYVAVVRRLDRAPRLVATVASIFLVTLLVGLQRGLVHALTTDRQRLLVGVTNAVPPPGHLSLTLGGARFGLPDLLLVLAATAGLVGTAVFLRRSATGTAIRAAAENADRAQTLGVDVVKLTGRIWLLVGALSGVAAVLGAMSTPAGDGSATSTGAGLVRVLVVVVAARLVSLPMVGLAALALGVLTAAVQFAVRSTSVLDGALVLVVSALLLLQRTEGGRADADTSSAYLTGRAARPVPAALAALPGIRGLRRGGALALAVVLLGLPFVFSPSQTSTATTTVLQAMVGMSLLVLTGWAGLASLGQFGLAAVGAWAAAGSGLPFALALPLGAVTGAAAAIALGLPALRLRPLTLAISTLTFAAAVPAVLLNPEALGRALPAELPRPRLLGVDLASQRAFYYLALAALLLVVGATAGLRRSRTARVLLAARDNAPAAQSFGIPVLRARLQAFALSGAVAGLAGALFAYQQTGVRSESFTVDASLQIFCFTVIGGLGTLGGPLLGFVVLLALALARLDPALTALVTGGGGLALLLLAPGGLAQLALGVRDGLLRRVAQRRGIAVPGLQRERLAGPGVAPITARTTTGGAAAFVPTTYALPGDWATDARRRLDAPAGRTTS